jgi:hypothetical protein
MSLSFNPAVVSIDIPPTLQIPDSQTFRLHRRRQRQTLVAVLARFLHRVYRDATPF